MRGDEVYPLQQQYQKNGRLGIVALCASLCRAVTTAAPGACPSSERMCGTVTAACMAVCHHPIIQIHVHNIPQAGWIAHPRSHSSGCDGNAGTPSSASAQPRTAGTVGFATMGSSSLFASVLLCSRRGMQPRSNVLKRHDAGSQWFPLSPVKIYIQNGSCQHSATPMVYCHPPSVYLVCG